MSEPTPDAPQPPSPDGTETRMYRDGRRYPFRNCRWCQSVLDREHGITCPICDRPEPPTKETTP